MQIVIDIPKECYKNLLNNYRFSSEEIPIVSLAIATGIPLPQNHGRLIDADALEELCYEHEIGNDAFDGEPLIEQGQYDDGDNIWKPLFDFAPTLIEADNEKE